MQKWASIIFIATFLLVLFILSSCNESIVVENKTISDNQKTSINKDYKDSFENGSSKIKPRGKIIGYEIVEVNGKKKKIPIYYDPSDTSDGGIKALACDYYSVNKYDFYKYELKSGKSLGIANQGPQYKSATELHDTWGFNGYIVGSDAQRISMQNIGYDYSNIMASVPIDDNGQYIIPSGTFSKYYIDEPFEHQDISWSNMVSMANDIYSINSSAELYIASYKDDPSAWAWYNGLNAAAINTRIICDQYYDGTAFYGHDQRTYWSWFKNNYGSSRVKSNWISLIIDGRHDDFDILFEKANNLGLNTMWLYAGDANNCEWYEQNGICETLTQSNYSTFLPQFCYAAWQYGWLRRFVELNKYMYHCPEEYGDPCYCEDNDSGWELAWIQYLGTYEVYP